MEYCKSVRNYKIAKIAPSTSTIFGVFTSYLYVTFCELINWYLPLEDMWGAEPQGSLINWVLVALIQHQLLFIICIIIYICSRTILYVSLDIICTHRHQPFFIICFIWYIYFFNICHIWINIPISISNVTFTLFAKQSPSQKLLRCPTMIVYISYFAVILSQISYC